MAALYDSEITVIMDRLVPARTIRCRKRASDPWFDDDCRVAKRCVRMFERDFRRVCRRTPPDAAAIDAAKRTWSVVVLPATRMDGQQTTMGS